MSSLLRSEPKGLIPPPPAFKIGCYNTFNWRSYPSRKLAHRTCDASTRRGPDEAFVVSCCHSAF